jgi:protein ImuA
MSSPSPRRETLEQLRRQLRGTRAPASDTIVSTPTGLAGLDRLLPGGGIPGASVIEWISELPGQSAASLALRSAAPLLQRPGCLAVIDEHREFYPAAITTHGIPLSRLLLVRIPPEVSSSPLRLPKSAAGLSEHSQALWALEQTARCRGVSVILTWLHRCTSAVVRRLQLAVESSGSVLMLMRPAQALQQPSFADLRLHISSCSADNRFRRIRIQLLRARHSLQSVGTTELLQDTSEQFLDG